MKRIVIYCMILAAVCFVPVQKQDVASLEPVQAVWMSLEDEKVTLLTDTGDVGTGGTVQEALTDMKSKSTGIIYLDTAEFLLVTQQAQQKIPELAELLKGSVRVCLWEGQGEITDAALYIQARKLGIRLDKWQKNADLPVIPDLKKK